MSDRTENSDDSRASGTGGRNIRHRNAVIVNVAQPEDVESTPEARSFVRASDIVKIFVGDDEIAEVTMEQVQRVKMSKYGILRATVHWLKAQGPCVADPEQVCSYSTWYCLYCTISLR